MSESLKQIMLTVHSIRLTGRLLKRDLLFLLPEIKIHERYYEVFLLWNLLLNVFTLLALWTVPAA